MESHEVQSLNCQTLFGEAVSGAPIALYTYKSLVYLQSAYPYHSKSVASWSLIDEKAFCSF